MKLCALYCGLGRWVALVSIGLLAITRIVGFAAPTAPGAKKSALLVPCVAPCPSNSSGEGAPESDLKAFGDKAYFWKKKSLSVRFLGGSEALREKVLRTASEWSKHANITFTRAVGAESDIRIAFDDTGHWSRVGTDANNAPPNAATMNLQIDESTSDDEIARVVLHEFGHALGFMHEHRQPGNPIQWNKPVVAAWYKGPPNNWSDADIEEQVFKPYNSPTTVSNGYHPDSIMHYPILEGWTLNGQTVGWNKALVQSDKDFAAKWYPKAH